ncbi:hypothetical protein BASA81_008078 [Batrachochytrium salamandrivorans]|nr:hypothetical protein BASA81_008078 [Batrachochytrium salamandrivorans]
MLAIVCVVEGDMVSAGTWSRLFGPSQAKVVEAADADPLLFPGGLLLVGGELLKSKPVETRGGELGELLQQLLVGLNVDPPTDSRETYLPQYQDSIRQFTQLGLRVCGLGAGAIELAYYYHFQLDMLLEPHLAVEQIGTKCLLSRMLHTKIVAPPIVVEGEEDDGFLLTKCSKQDIAIFERELVLGMNAMPEVSPDMLLDHLELCTSVAAAEVAIESVKHMNRLVVEHPPFWGLVQVCTFLGKVLMEEEEEEEEEVEASEINVLERNEEMIWLRRRVGELEMENLDLKFKLKAFVIPLKSTGGEKGELEDLQINSLLLGRTTNEEDLELANSLLKPLHSSLRVNRREHEFVNSAPVLCLAFVGEGTDQRLVWGQTNHILECDNGESIKLDAPPVFLSTFSHTKLAVGTLSGSIYLFTCGEGSWLSNPIKLPSPHRKHLMGIEYGLNDQQLFSLSRDLKLCLWENGVVVSTLLFDENQPPECCCVVVVDRVAMLAIAKRNSHALSLVPFSPSLEEGQRLCALELGVDETCLAMARCEHALPVLALITDRGSVLLVDVRNGGMRLRSFFGGVVCDEYSRPALVWRGNWLACTSTSPNSILLFAVSNPDQTKPITLVGEHSASIRALALGTAPNHHQQLVLASGAFDKRIIYRQFE